MKTEWKYLVQAPPLEKSVDAINGYAAQSRQALATQTSSNPAIPAGVDGWIDRLRSYVSCARANNETVAALGAAGGQAYLETDYARSFDFAMITAGASAALEHQHAKVSANPANQTEVERYSVLAFMLRASETAHFEFGNPRPSTPAVRH